MTGDAYLRELSAMRDRFAALIEPLASGAAGQAGDGDALRRLQYLQRQLAEIDALIWVAQSRGQ